MNEWENEPDTKDFEHSGLKCAIRRGPQGALCGYVGIKSDHPWHGKEYGDSVKVDESILERPVDIDKIGAINLLVGSADPESGMIDIVLAVDVHGGLTYSADHAPKDDPDGLWWFGFDCAHHGDLSPSDSFGFGGVYRDIEYVTSECNSLAEQLNIMAA